MQSLKQKAQAGFTLIELMIVVAIIGILASLAIPAYSDYTAKSQASEAFVLLDGVKSQVASSMMDNPAASNCGLSAATISGGKYVTSITDSNSSGTCTLTATFGTNVNASISGATVKMIYSAASGFVTSQGQTSGSINSKYLPQSWQ